MLGDDGSGKTTLAIHLARHLFGLGHTVFSNASCLFGWRLEHEEMYTAMGFMPANSVLLIDESCFLMLGGISSSRQEGGQDCEGAYGQAPMKSLLN